MVDRQKEKKGIYAKEGSKEEQGATADVGWRQSNLSICQYWISPYLVTMCSSQGHNISSIPNIDDPCPINIGQ